MLNGQLIQEVVDFFDLINDSLAADQHTAVFW